MYWKELTKTIKTVDDILNNQTITNAMLKNNNWCNWSDNWFKCGSKTKTIKWSRQYNQQLRPISMTLMIPLRKVTSVHKKMSQND